jgi:3D (Asp-Asp-Asp) domain-containing protein
MALHIGIKLCAIGLAVASLVTAFNTPPVERRVELAVIPTVTILPEPALALEELTNAKAYGPEANPRYLLRATGYNSMVSQTNSQPFITATGARTQWGIVAVSRDLLHADIPYGSLVRIRDLGSVQGRGYGKYQDLLDQQLFIVEDTLHQRKRQQIDVWFEHLHEALEWGKRQVEVEVVRYGRHGPVLEHAPHPDAAALTPQLSALRPPVATEDVSSVH